MIAQRAGVAPWLVTVPGIEVSTTTFGHFGGYPLRLDPERAGQGAIPWFGATPSEVFDALRAAGDAALGGAIVQVNHPRRSKDFFTAIGLDPVTGLATTDPLALDLPASTDLNDFDFDVIEVWNGLARGGNEETLGDCLALLALGHSFTMLGNSDSHNPDEPPGAPRNYIRVADDSRGGFEWAEVARAIGAGDVTVAAGIFVTAQVLGPEVGGIVPVQVRVQAPPWVDVNRLRIYAGRDTAVDVPLGDPGLPVRFEGALDVPTLGARFVVVRADGTREPTPLFDFPPFGVTNALRIPSGG
jgi:hypothetical protein